MAHPYNRSISRLRQISRQASTISNASWKSCKSYFSHINVGRVVRQTTSVTVTGEQLTVEAVRSQLLKVILTDGHREEVDPKDFEKIQSDDWFIERFIVDALNGVTDRRKIALNSVVETLMDCLKWRKESGVNQITPDLLLKDLYDCRLIVFGECKDSCEETMFIRAKMHKKIDEWSQALVDCVCYYFETNCADPKKRLNIVIDCDGVGYAQADVDLAFKMVPICFKYYPCYVNKVVYYNVPWLLRPLTRLVSNILPVRYRDLIQVADRKTIGDVLGGERYLPTFLGGSVQTTGMRVPEGAGSIDDVGCKRGISKENVTKMKKYVNEVMSRAM